jgi:hypothetical protein
MVYDFNQLMVLVCWKGFELMTMSMFPLNHYNGNKFSSVAYSTTWIISFNYVQSFTTEYTTYLFNRKKKRPQSDTWVWEINHWRERDNINKEFDTEEFNIKEELEKFERDEILAVEDEWKRMWEKRELE